MVEPFREVCRHAGTAPFVIHHAGWATDGDDARGRGSTAIRAWSDLELALRAETRNGKTLHRLNLKKSNFAPRWPDAKMLELNPATLVFQPVDADNALCSTEALVAWMLIDLDGVWDKKRLIFFTAVCANFHCSDRTARNAAASAIQEKKFTDHGREKALEVVAKGVCQSEGHCQ